MSWLIIVWTHAAANTIANIQHTKKHTHIQSTLGRIAETAQVYTYIQHILATMSTCAFAPSCSSSVDSLTSCRPANSYISLFVSVFISQFLCLSKQETFPTPFVGVRGLISVQIKKNSLNQEYISHLKRLSRIYKFTHLATAISEKASHYVEYIEVMSGE